ncbi:MAG: hypothetical protein KME26_30330 [Oscillatoria princeps RMCB-10]|nr:hypothetical protein [Oscillatoria princeps RMCB-10]
MSFKGALGCAGSAVSEPALFVATPTPSQRRFWRLPLRTVGQVALMTPFSASSPLPARTGSTRAISCDTADGAGAPVRCEDGTGAALRERKT